MNSLKVPEKAKGDPLGIFNIHPVAKYKKKKGGPLKTLKCFKKNLTKLKKRREKSHSAEKWDVAPLWILYFKLEVLGCVQNQVLKIFGKNEYFKKSGTYTMSNLVRRKKGKAGHLIVGHFSQEKRRLKTFTPVFSPEGSLYENVLESNVVHISDVNFAPLIFQGRTNIRTCFYRCCRLDSSSEKND